MNNAAEHNMQRHFRALCAERPHHMELQTAGVTESGVSGDHSLTAETSSAKRRRTKATSPAAAVDVAYVRRVMRKHREADRRKAAAALASTIAAPTTMGMPGAAQTLQATAVVAPKLFRSESIACNSVSRFFDSRGSTRSFDTSTFGASPNRELEGAGNDASGCGSISECSSGGWDAGANKCGELGGCGEACSMGGVALRDDGWLEALLQDGSPREGP